MSNNQQRNNQRDQQQGKVEGEGQKPEEVKAPVVSLNIPGAPASDKTEEKASDKAEEKVAEKAPGEEGEEKTQSSNEGQDASALLVQTPNPIETSTAQPGLAPEEKIAAPVVENTQEKTPASIPSLKVQATPNRTPPSGQIKRSGAASREASPPAAQPEQAPASTQFAALVSREKKEGTAQAIDLITFLERYVVEMAPRKVTTTATVLRFQEGLLSHITRVIEQAPAAQFKRLWRILIAFTGEYKKGAFGPAYYARGAKDWKGDSKQFDILTSAINLLEASAVDMKTVGQVADVSLLANKGFSEEGRGRLLGFYAN